MADAGGVAGPRPAHHARRESPFTFLFLFFSFGEAAGTFQRSPSFPPPRSVGHARCLSLSFILFFSILNPTYFFFFFQLFFHWISGRQCPSQLLPRQAPPGRLVRRAARPRPPRHSGPLLWRHHRLCRGPHRRALRRIHHHGPLVSESVQSQRWGVDGQYWQILLPCSLASSRNAVFCLTSDI